MSNSGIQIDSIEQYIRKVRTAWKRSFDRFAKEVDKHYKSGANGERILDALKAKHPELNQAELEIMRAQIEMRTYYDVPWFRGMTKDKPLLPALYREAQFPRKSWSDDLACFHSENELVQNFRLRSRSMGLTPDRDRIEEWLSLMQHAGLPTRLLDWTEGALIGLYFAVEKAHEDDYKDEVAVVWMLNPSALNIRSVNIAFLPLTWMPPAMDAFRAAFGDGRGPDYPIAIYPSSIHSRISAQRSAFTIHGSRRGPLEDLLPDLVQKGHLVKFQISQEQAKYMVHDLRLLGISRSTLFPDFDGLAAELRLSS